MATKYRRFVAVNVEGTTETHLPHPLGEYATLCGLDGDDPGSRQSPAKPASKVTCDDCKAIFELCRKYQQSDFI